MTAAQELERLRNSERAQKVLNDATDHQRDYALGVLTVTAPEQLLDALEKARESDGATR